mmetsp:Transcript_43521/g.105631  ORF Transcript_43521/g.105631 Transcript_43521/m.105631 type:complete len:2203 (+) Transcript_43521:102-6710(+)
MDPASIEQKPVPPALRSPGKVLRGPVLTLPDGTNYAEWSFGFLHMTNPLRQVAIRITQWPAFDNMILLAILVNCLFMALNPPFENLERESDTVFVAVFTLEMTLKMIALGFIFERAAFLRSAWNWLDFVVVVTGLMTIYVRAMAGESGLDAVSAVRAVRLLRPLRTINRIPGMRVLVRSLLDAIPAMGSVMLLCSFIFLVFGIIGVQLFSGTLHHRCYYDDVATLAPSTLLCPPSVSFAPDCTAASSTLILGPSPIVVRDVRVGWSPLASGTAPGQLLLRLSEDNVTWQSYELNVSSYNASAPFSDGCVPQLAVPSPPPFRLRADGAPLKGVRARYASLEWPSCTSSAFTTGVNISAVEVDTSMTELGGLGGPPTLSMCCDHSDGLCSGRECEAGQSCLWTSENPFGVNSFDDVFHAFLTIFQIISLEGWVNVMYMIQDGYYPHLVPAYFVLLVLLGAFFVINLFLAVVLDSFQLAQIVANNDKQEAKATEPVVAAKRSKTMRERVVTASRNKWRWVGTTTIFSFNLEIFHKLVHQRRFEQIFMALIVFNTLLLCLYHHDMSAEFERTLEDMNVVLAICFTVEICCKVLGLGLRKFLESPANLGDTAIVALSQIEVVFYLAGSKTGADAKYSILRTFRLLRVLKLARSFSGLVQVLNTVTKSLSQVTYLLAILLLFMFIFALLGMEAFGGQYSPLVESSAGYLVPAVKWNFDDFPTALITLFVVLTGENWNEVYFDAFSALGGEGIGGLFAHAFFILVVVIGNYMVLSLFVAILLGNLSAPVAEDATSRRRRSLLRELLLRLRRYLHVSSGSCLSWFLGEDIPGMDVDFELQMRSLSTESTRPRSTSKPVNRSTSTRSDRSLSNGSVFEQPNPERTRSPSKTRSHSREGEFAAPTCASSPPSGILRNGELRNPTPPKRTMFGETRSASSSGQSETPPLKRPPLRGALHCSDRTEGTNSDSSSPIVPRRPPPKNSSATDSAIEGGAIALPGCQRLPGRQPISEFAFSSTPTSQRIGSRGKSSRRRESPANSETSPYCQRSETQASSSTSPTGKRSWSKRTAIRLSTVATTRKHRSAKDLGPPKPGDPIYVPLLDRDLALGCLSRHNRFRKFVIWLVEHPKFDKVVFVLIVASSITMSLPQLDYPGISLACDNKDYTSYWGAACDMSAFVNISDIFFTAAFTLEFMLKVVAMGFSVPTTTAYLSNGWNQLDFCVVAVSLVSLFASSSSALTAVKTLRSLRALRPLRVIAHNPGMRLVVNSLLMALPGVIHVLLIQLLFLLIFGILGVQLFMGRFADCTDASILLREDCTGTFTYVDVNGTELTATRRWQNPDIGHFDDVFSAILTLFEMSMLERWPEVMYRGMDSFALDEAPRRDASRWAAAYFVLWIFVGALFISNLFVGVVVDNFIRIKEQEQGLALLTDNQKEWVSTMLRCARTKPQRTFKPEGQRAQQLWRLVRSDRFEWCLMALIVSNVFFMATEHCVPNDDLQLCVEDKTDFRKVTNWTFSAIFLAEMFIKLGAYQWNYFKQGWNIFDFFLVCSSVLDVSIELAASGSPSFNPTILRVLRVFRIGRLLRLIRSASGLRHLLATLAGSLPSLLNVGSLLLLLIFVYAVLGVSLFSNLTLSGNFINRQANFRTLPNAILLLFRSVTGESWNGLMHDCMVSEESGRCSAANDTCGSAPAAIIFFVSFTLVGGFVLLNLVIAVILENFFGQAGNEERVVPDDVINQYKEEWERLDPKGLGNISSDLLMVLLRRVAFPLGFQIRLRTGSCILMPRSEQMRILDEMDVPDHCGFLNFQELLHCLTRYAHREEIVDDGSFGDTRDRVSSESQSHRPSADQADQVNVRLDVPALPVFCVRKVHRELKAALKSTHARELCTPRWSQAELHAALMLQAVFKGRRFRRVLQAAKAGILDETNAPPDMPPYLLERLAARGSSTQVEKKGAWRRSLLGGLKMGAAHYEKSFRRSVSRLRDSKSDNGRASFGKRHSSELSVPHVPRLSDGSRPSAPRLLDQNNRGTRQSRVNVREQSVCSDAGGLSSSWFALSPSPAENEVAPAENAVAPAEAVPCLPEGLTPFDTSVIGRCKRIRLPTRAIFQDANVSGVVAKVEAANSYGHDLLWIPVMIDREVSVPDTLMQRRTLLYDPQASPLGILTEDMVMPDAGIAVQELVARKSLKHAPSIGIEHHLPPMVEHSSDKMLPDPFEC